MSDQSFQMINFSTEDLSNLITTCISEQLKIIVEVINSEPSNSEKDILSIKEVKDLLDLSSTTLWKYRKNGTLPAKKIGSRVYYSKKELFNFLNNAA